MMKFSYIALSPDYQKLTGVIVAKDQQDARAQLHKIGLSVIDIKEANVEEITKEENKKTKDGTEVDSFYFKVLDQKGEEMEGTIDSFDRKTAFRRLMTEYNFKIILLCSAKIPVDQREIEGKKNLEQVEKEIEEEFDLKSKHEKGDEEGFHNNQKLMEKKKELIEAIESICKKAEEIIDKYGDKIPAQEVQDIQRKVGDLLRMRISTNVKYTKGLVKELFELLENVIRQYSLESLSNAGKIGDEDDEKDIYKEMKHYENVSEAESVIGNIKNMSRRITNFMNKNKIESQEEKSDKVGKFYGDAKMHFRGFLRAKSKQEKKRHLVALKRIVQDKIKVILNNWKEKIKTLKNTEININKDDYNLSLNLKMEKDFFYEFYISAGWTLGFYIIYLFIVFYRRLKFEEDLSTDWIDKSLQSPLIFNMAGVLFFIFLALSIKINFARKSFLKSIIITLPIFFLMFVFLFNF